MGTRKLRKDSRASRVLVEIDRAWWYYYSEKPLPWEERPHGWPFCIKSLIKYFPGCYEEAEKAAKRAAVKAGADTIYLIP